MSSASLEKTPSFTWKRLSKEQKSILLQDANERLSWFSDEYDVFFTQSVLPQLGLSRQDIERVVRSLFCLPHLSVDL